MADDAGMAKAHANQLLAILRGDLEVLERIDDYLHGRHDGPYIPDHADDEYKLLASRCISNWTPLLVGTPAQALYVDGFRPGPGGAGVGNGEGAPVEPSTRSSHWDVWQRSRLDARQSAVYRGALAYGHSFAVVEKGKSGKSLVRGLSPLRTAAIFEDPASDEAPVAALTVVSWPNGETKKAGQALLWDGSLRYEVTFLTDPKATTVTKGVRHGATECPVTRFAAYVDLDGRTTGVIEPIIPLQDRINQTVFDLLVAQTYASFKVRYATGMAPPVRRNSEGEIEFDEQGQPIPLPINHNAKRFLFAEDHEVKFGSLDESPLDGYINSIDMSIRHLAAVSQTPPHHLLGQIANLSAEALAAAETSLSRMVDEFRKSFGESWERVFRIAAMIDGTAGADDYHGEVVWRDMEARSLSQTADALGKMAESLDIPKRGLWPRIPGVTQTEMDSWKDMREDDDPELQLSAALTRASGSIRDVNREAVPA